MIEPGVYQVHYRAATLRECWRIAGPGLFHVSLAWKLLGQRGQYLWLPPSEAAVPCGADTLSQDARAHLAPVVEQLQRLGYTRGLFIRHARNLNPNARDAGAYQALHDDGMRVFSAAFVHMVCDPAPALKTVALSGLLIAEDLSGTLVLDHRYYLDNGLWSRVIRLKPVGLEGIHARIQQELQAARGPLRRFATLDELRAAIDERSDRWYERLIQRGLCRKVPADEEREVLARFGLGKV